MIGRRDPRKAGIPDRARHSIAGKQEYPTVHSHSIAAKQYTPSRSFRVLQPATATHTAMTDTIPHGPNRLLSCAASSRDGAPTALSSLTAMRIQS